MNGPRHVVRAWIERLRELIIPHWDPIHCVDEQVDLSGPSSIHGIKEHDNMEHFTCGVGDRGEGGRKEGVHSR